jgi:hypothetical protein
MTRSTKKETKPMIVSPFYYEITDRAIEMLNAGAINGHTTEELRSWGDCRELRNDVHVALVMARNEVLARVAASGKRDARRAVRFNVGNFDQAALEIVHMILRRVLPARRAA